MAMERGFREKYAVRLKAGFNAQCIILPAGFDALDGQIVDGIVRNR
jgi:hypothetical protein